jgi:putative oxidoreductase
MLVASNQVVGSSSLFGRAARSKGGLLLLIGFRSRAAAAVLAIFTIAAAIFFHSNFADQNQAIHFLKNFAIAGGLLQVAAVGAGALMSVVLQTFGR